MPSQVPTPENDRIRFSSTDDVRGSVEGMLKRRYGRGIYVDSVSESPSGDIVLNLGNVVPKDLSDSRERDDVLKFIHIDNIHQLIAEPTNGHYIIELPDRDTIQEGFEERQQEIVQQLDLTMAKTIYRDIIRFGEVTNQLTPIRQILRWTRNRSPLAIQRINRNQRSDRTLEYIDVLEALGYLEVDDEAMVHAGDRLRSFDLNQVPADTFGEAIVGDVIQQGYHTLQERLDLRMLSHYPMFAGAYYFDAIQRREPGLWLDLEAIQDNLYEQHGNRFRKLYIEDKLAQLNHAGVIEKDGDFVKSDETVYEEVSQRLNVVG